LDEWKKRATNEVIAEVERRGGDARARLYALFAIVMESDGRLDMAIRAWASKDPAALAVLASIDKRRLAYLVSLFQELGFTSDQATARARLVYNAHVGQHAMGIPPLPQGQSSKAFDSVFEMLVRKEAK
jgi:hypothetical protein